MDDCSATKILLDNESDQGPKSEEEDEDSERVKEWKQSLEYAEGARRAQQIAGEILWLSTRTRPDLCYPIQKMTSAATKDPVNAGVMGTRILRYLKGTKEFWLDISQRRKKKKK